MVSLTESKRSGDPGRRWPFWVAGLALGTGIAALIAGDAAPPIARFLIEKVIQPFAEITLRDFLCL